MNYLIYIEHSAENLQFFLWYRDYERRFLEAPSSEKSLAPEWTKVMEDETLIKIKKEAAELRKKDLPAADIFRGTDFDKSGGEQIVDNKDPFNTSSRNSLNYDDTSTIFSSSQATSNHSKVEESFSCAGAKQPCRPPTPKNSTHAHVSVIIVY